MTTLTDMMSDLIKFCNKHNAVLNSLTQQNNFTEYELILNWRPKGHDGSKCRKLTIPGMEDVMDDLDKLTIRKKEIPDADGEVPCEKDSLHPGDEVIYYGADKTMHGQKCVVDKVYAGGYKVWVKFYDIDSIYQTSFTHLRRRA